MRRRKSDDEQEIKELVAVAVTLRNAFAPKHQLTTATSASTSIDARSSMASATTTMLNNMNSNIGTTRSEADEEDAENDVGSSSSSFPSSYSSSRRSLEEQSNLPLEMELSVPHSLLVELKHSYQHWKRMKDRVSDRFGLGKMDHENSGKNDANADGDIHRLVSVCTLVISDSSSQSHLHSRLFIRNSTCKDSRHGVKERNSTIAGGVGTANHPLWDHIHERLDDLYNEVISPAQHLGQHQDQHHHEQTQRERERIWTDIRNCMRIQCKAILISNKHTHSHANDMNMHSNAETTRTEIILTSASLNAKKLVILPINPNTYDINSTSEAEEPSMLGVSKYTNAIPHALPRNSLMVHFSDGSTRVLPTLFSFLVKRGVISGLEQERDKDGNISGSGNSNAGSRNGSKYDVQVDKFEKRFEDDIFNMLTDSSSSQNGHGHGNGNGRAVKLNLGSHTPPIIGNESGRANGNGNFVNGNANATVKGSFTDAFNSLSMHSSMTTPSKDGNILLKSMELSDDDAESDESENFHAHAHAHGNRPIYARAKGDSFEAARAGDYSHRAAVAVSDEKDRDSCDVIKRIQDADEEIELLQRALEEEEEALKKEKETQQVQVKLLQDFITEVNEIDKEGIEIDEEANIASIDLVQKELDVHSKRRQLLKELNDCIFPIQTGDVFTINGVPLPKNMDSLTASDEIISAGLGFVCLVVNITSKYLSIPLRHRLIFNSSRSAVREDSDVFPLFKERVVEKEQFDRGIILLHRNIDHLLQVQGVSISVRRERTHILAKLELLLDHIN